ncbi:hypothetical protein [Actinomadura livida]|uniref:Uncharacterized protein n=1 Tax=Actinomadura livida TaxID=79909 RepID=A0A7W7I960_9ACTN|nr:MULTISPECIES: hypothetical protein [Actinomadura]MBB4772827.1 hypothetical protein [Actinomadura catellatispora]GGU13001.1 hypothetical protein GCM10010208_42420 [Actinomadura livida]
MSSPMDQRPVKSVYLHVGAPAAGTSFLPRALWANRRRLGDTGVCYPLAGPQEHFAAVMDLREMSWGGRREPDWDGAWDRVVQRIREWDGHAAVLSQGLLAGATEQQVARVVAALEPAEVHVVFATHDLGWQLILDWQEQLRHAHTVTFERFVDDLVARGIDAPEPFGEMFWGLHDPVRVLGTWASAVPKERIHVLTLPPPDGSPRVLWDRFRGLTGIGAAVCDIEGIPAGGPLSAVEAELLRRLNERIGPALRRDYERMVREHLAGYGPDGAGGAAGRTRMGLPARHNEWAALRTRELAESLRASGYDVAGDLGELATAPDPAPFMLPGDVPEELIATASVGVVAHLLEELTLAHERIGLAHLQSEMAGVQENLRRLLEAAAAPSPPLQRAARRATGKRNP